MPNIQEPKTYFFPSPEQLDFILNTAEALADKFDRDPSEFSVNLMVNSEGVSRALIGYIGLKPLDLNQATDTVRVKTHQHTINDYGNSKELAVPIPISF